MRKTHSWGFFLYKIKIFSRFYVLKRALCLFSDRHLSDRWFPDQPFPDHIQLSDQSIEIYMFPDQGTGLWMVKNRAYINITCCEMVQLLSIRMTRPVSFFRRVPIVLELYRRKWQGGNIYTMSKRTLNTNIIKICVKVKLVVSMYKHSNVY